MGKQEQGPIRGAEVKSVDETTLIRGLGLPQTVRKRPFTVVLSQVSTNCFAKTARKIGDIRVIVNLLILESNGPSTGYPGTGLTALHEY